MERAKRKAAAEGRSLTVLIEDGLRGILNERGARTKRVLPPVSKAVGGLKPGIDLNDTAALQEMDEFEYVVRLR